MKVGDLVAYKWAGSTWLAMVLKLEKKNYSKAVPGGKYLKDSIFLHWLGGGSGPRPTTYEEIPGWEVLVAVDRQRHLKVALGWLPLESPGGFNLFNVYKK